MMDEFLQYLKEFSKELSLGGISRTKKISGKYLEEFPRNICLCLEPENETRFNLRAITFKLIFNIISSLLLWFSSKIIREDSAIHQNMM